MFRTYITLVLCKKHRSLHLRHHSARIDFELASLHLRLAAKLSCGNSTALFYCRKSRMNRMNISRTICNEWDRKVYLVIVTAMVKMNENENRPLGFVCVCVRNPPILLICNQGYSVHMFRSRFKSAQKYRKPPDSWMVRTVLSQKST